MCSRSNIHPWRSLGKTRPFSFSTFIRRSFAKPIVRSHIEEYHDEEYPRARSESGPPIFPTDFHPSLFRFRNSIRFSDLLSLLLTPLSSKFIIMPALVSLDAVEIFKRFERERERELVARSKIYPRVEFDFFLFFFFCHVRVMGTFMQDLCVCSGKIKLSFANGEYCNKCYHLCIYISCKRVRSESQLDDWIVIFHS